MVNTRTVVATFPPLPAFVTLYLVIPIATLATYLLIRRSATVRSAPPSVRNSLIPIIFCWGGVLFVGFSAVSGHWFGLASIAAFFLLFVSPFIFIVLAAVLWPLSRQHRDARLALYSCFGYFGIIIAAWLLFVAHA